MFYVFLILLAQINCYRYVAYYTSWSTYARNFQPSNIPYDKISHLNYAFANIVNGKIAIGDSYADTDKAFPGDSWDTTKQAYRGNFWQILKVAKPKYPNLRVLISIGGWTWSGQFSTVAATAASRTTFVNSVVQFLTTYEFDGVDIDWEYPVTGGLEGNAQSPNDAANYVLLLQALRAGLNTLPGQKRIITVAAPAGPQITKYLDIPGLAANVDFINIMTYDFRGGWSKYTGHQTPLYPMPASSPDPANDPDRALGSTAESVNYYLSKGMPSHQISIGVAMYGRGWSGVTNNNNGLYQKYTTIPKGTWDDGTSGNTGVFDYKAIVNMISSGQTKRYWDDAVKAPWVFSSQLQMISYDDPQSVGEKLAYVQKNCLGGLMAWDLSGDNNAELSNLISSSLFGSSGVPDPALATLMPENSQTDGPKTSTSELNVPAFSFANPNSKDINSVSDQANPKPKPEAEFNWSSFLIGLGSGLVVAVMIIGFFKWSSSNSSQRSTPYTKVKPEENKKNVVKIVKTSNMKSVKQEALLSK